MAERPIFSKNTKRTLTSPLQSPIVRKTPKVVRVVAPEDDPATDDEENVNEVNIVMSATISPSKSPSKRKRDSIALLNLDEELKKAADAKKRTSDYINSAKEAEDRDADHEHNLASIVASLRRQNEDLRAKLDAGGVNPNTSLAVESNKNEAEMRKIAEKECESLRTTVAKLDRLLNIEREERALNEKKTLDLLEETKNKWTRKEENKLTTLRADLQQANQVVEDMEKELLLSQSELEAAKRDKEALGVVKQSLKAKLIECKSKLEATAAKYDEKTKSLEALETKYKELEKVTNEAATENNRKKRRTTLTLNENRAELDAIREVVEQMKKKRSSIETELLEAQSKNEVLQRKVDLLEREKNQISKEYQTHLAKSESASQKLQAEIERLKSDNEKLEDKALALETKVASKDRKLGELEEIMQAIEKRIPDAAATNEMSSQREEELQKKIDEKQKKIEELQEQNEKQNEDFRLHKVELRIAERKANEATERVGFLRDMLKEEREKIRKIEGASHSEAERIAELEKDVNTERLDKQRHEEAAKSLQERLDKVKSELDALRKDQETAEEYAEKCDDLERKLLKRDKELEDYASVQNNYKLTKTVCYELEDQIKELMKVIEKLESTQEKLQESNSELRGKSNASSTELITLRSQLNEAKSMMALKESQVRELDEKCKDSKRLYETETERWRTRYDEVNNVQKDQSSTMLELKDALETATDERDRVHEMNTYLSEQNTKLKEESATLITGIQSLKDSNMMLQGSVRELAEKLARRDAEIERQGDKISKLGEEMRVKETEIKTTNEQIKKLTHHLPDRTPQKGKKEKSHTLANLLNH